MPAICRGGWMEEWQPRVFEMWGASFGVGDTDSNQMKKYAYLAPEAALFSIEVEQGFVTSSPDFNGTTPDYDEDNNE